MSFHASNLHINIVFVLFLEVAYLVLAKMFFYVLSFTNKHICTIV